MFVCPNCSGRLNRSQNELGIFWVCPACSGRAVGLAVLRKAIAPKFINQLWAAVRDERGFPSRPCPACTQRMVEVTIAPDAVPFKLDVCKPCEFVWFDPGEMEAAPPKPPPARLPGEMAEKYLPLEAREAMALYKVQQIAEAAHAEDPSPDEDWKTVPALFGFPVEAETNPLRHWPWLTWSLAAIIAAVSIWSFFDLENVINQFGLIPAEAFRQHGATLFTSFFLHGGTWHLIGNLYFLLIFGDNVEDYLGRGRFLLLLVLATVAGDWFHILAAPNSLTPCIGASGGISGVIAFYALQFPRAQLGFMLRYYWRYSWVQIPAWGAFALWILLQFVGAAQQVAGFSDISSMTHLGGTATGLILWLVWRKKAAIPAPDALVREI